ncbi:MAG: zinc transporter ZupT [Candidatus Omnitrophica bacterium]|nr:zinc transporter ZupT [Candidatus Omnitrophota bacterium]
MEIRQIVLPLLLTCFAAIFTVLGSLVSFLIRDFKKTYLNFGLGLSAGVMIYVSFVELFATSARDIGFFKANIAFFAGILIVMLIDFVIPHEYIEEHISMTSHQRKVLASGVLITFGIAIHNFPEGLAVLMSSLVDIKLGVSLALAIALHNFPEGVAISLPIFYATKSKKKAFWYSFLAGIAEPVGALIGLLILMPFLSPAVLSFTLAFVAGIMVFISFDELLPLSYQGGEYHISILGVIIGMLIMALSLSLF